MAKPQTSFMCNFLNFKENRQPCYVHIFFLKYTRFMGMMCVYQSASRQESGNFGKAFKLIQGIGYTGNERMRKPNRMMRQAEISNSEKWLLLQGLTKRRFYGDQELRLSSRRLNHGGNIPEATVATEGGAGVSLLPRYHRKQSEGGEVPWHFPSSCPLIFC